MERLNTTAWRSLLEDCSGNLFEQGGNVPPPGDTPPIPPQLTTSNPRRYAKPRDMGAGSGHYPMPTGEYGWTTFVNYLWSTGQLPLDDYTMQMIWDMAQSAGADFNWSQYGFNQLENGNWQVALGNPPGSAGALYLYYGEGGWNVQIAIP